MHRQPSGPQATLIRFSIRFRGVVIALAALLLGYGIYGLTQAKYDVFPEFAPPQVSIQTESPGLASEEVELLVTRPIESAVNGVPAVKMMRSISLQGLSVVTVYFNPASDIYRDRQVIAEQLATANLPAGVRRPAMTPLTSSTSIVLVAGLTSPTRSLMDLRTLADWTLRLRLLAVPGVAGVDVFSSDVRSIQIQVHPDRLIRFGLSLNDLLSAARRATGVRGGGFIDTVNQRVVLQSRGQSLSPADIARTVITSSHGATVTLGGVADVVDAPEPAIGAAAIEGTPGVILNISAQFGANTVDVTKGIEAALDQLRPVLEREGVTLHADLFRPANFIDTATGNVGWSLIIGGLLVIAVLFVFLFDLGTAAVSIVAIPLSLLAAVIVLQRLGVSLNTMTLGGLAIAIGVVVDDAVVDVENIVRRLRQNKALAAPRPMSRIILDASLEVRSAVVYATFAVLLVVYPIVSLSGLAGRFFAPLGVAYALAVLASLLVTLTVVPALSTLLLARPGLQEREPPLMRWAKGHYMPLLRAIEDRPRPVIAASVLLTVSGLAVLPFFGGSFIPDLQEGHFIVHMAMVPGTSIDESLRMGARVSEALSALPEIRSIAQRVGRAELSVDTLGTQDSEFEVDLKPGLSGDENEQAQADIRRLLAGFPGANFAVNTFLSERVDESLSGATAPVVVNVFGGDLQTLDRAAQDIAKVLQGVPGATEVQLQSPPGLPQMTIQLRKPDLQRWGFDAIDVLDALRTAYQGDGVGQIYEGDRAFDVFARLDSKSRGDPARIGDLPIRSPEGTYVLLKQIADAREVRGRYQIAHEGARRLQTVTANVSRTDVASFTRAAQAAIAAKVHLPAGAYIEWGGTALAQAQAQRDLLIDSAVAGLGVLLLLSIITRNWRNQLLVLVNLPFALVGGVMAAFATGGVLTLGSMVGFVTLFGITLRNSILMISHYEHLIEVEGVAWGPETAVRGAADRLTPILMTSLVTALGLLPLAIGMNDPGREIEGPMALVILGGLVTSMALNLLLLPTLALRYGRFAAKTPPGWD
jgi:CzcA family heavy metal efflux pump